MSWTKELNRRLKKSFPHETWDVLMNMFPDKTIQSIRTQASRLKLRRIFQPNIAFKEKVVGIDDESKCWEWTGHIKSNGYGQFQIDGKHCYAHRFSYEHYNGPIPKDMTINHICKNRKCVNPLHLEVMTRAENSLDGDSPFSQNARREKCVNGHSLSGENLYITSKGERKCKYCGKLRDRRKSGDTSRNGWETRKDTHDFFDDNIVKNFLRNHKTGLDNNGRHVISQIVAQYKNPIVLDCASGTAVNWEVFKKNNVSCRYIAFDRTKKLLDHARELYGDEIDYIEGYAQELYMVNRNVDVVIVRHLLEHIPSGEYEEIIKQAISLAEKELIVVFFLDPSNEEEDKIEYRGPDERGCFHWWNTYSWPKFMEFLSGFGYRIEKHFIPTMGAAHHDTIVRIIK